MTTPYRLPVVLLDGIEYFADHRLMQVRDVDNPHNWMTYETVMDRYESGYLAIAEADLNLIINRLVSRSI